MVLFYIYLIFTFTNSISLILNIIIIAALYFLITKDIKDEDHHKYYLTSLFLTALFFIFSTTTLISSFLALTEKLLISIVSVAGLFVYLFAQLTGFVYEYSKHLKEKRKNIEKTPKKSK
tara:strand:- start:169 stop:525 length:357 start_codon:yes stop_codon:yes gene_type:complete